MTTFMSLLSRGGDFGHFWLKQSRTTIWWDTKNIPEAPEQPEDIYFGVHPSRTRKSPSQRTLESDVAAINCLFADIDGKSFPGGKTAAASHIKSLFPRPTVIIDSGGGYHCYWILQDPFILDTPLKEEVAKALQIRWVPYVKGDKAVHDLARILRAPGTQNYKYSPPRHVRTVYENLDNLYDLDELETLLPTDEHRGGDEEEEDEDLEPVYPKPVHPNSLSLREIVTRAQQTRDGEKFKSLWRRQDDEYESTSEADLAFCSILAFWTGGDAEKIDALFRASERMRDKWERADYRNTTILRALRQVKKFYHDPGGYLTAGANDEGNAQCVASQCQDKFAYCEAFGWLRYTGSYWSTQMAEAAIEREIVRVLKQRRATAAKADTSRVVEAIIRASKPSASNVRNCKALLRSLVTVGVDLFDASLDDLNCPNGVLNLRKGTLTKPNGTQRFSYVIGTPYNSQADQSIWVDWLLEATGNKQEVVDFLQLAVGYSLTGHTREEVMFYIYGPARAGKGIFTETIMALLGGRPLATEVGMETFIEKRRGTDQGFDLASFKACRFIAASESKDSHWLDGSHIKRWTGGSPITCAHKYQKPFTYRPQFKIWLTSNFPLQMDPDDIAGWTRPKVIRFPTSHLGSEDKLLKGRMRSSSVLAGVLAWAVEGAMKWYALPPGGMIAPEIIKQETRKAQEDLDWVAQWVEEDIIDTGDEADRIPNALYYDRYREWCRERGAAVRRLKGLNTSLQRLGFKVKGKPFLYEGKTSRGWRGVKLRQVSFREQVERIGRQSVV